MIPKWAELLLLLQSADLKIRELKKRLQLLPGERKQLTERINSLLAGKENAKKTVLSIEMEIKKAESDISKDQEAAQKLRQQSAMVKKNSEYTAMLNQIATLNMHVSDLESVILEAYDKLEEAKAALRETDSEADAKIRSAREELAELDDFEKDICADIEAKTAERKQYEPAVEGSLLRRYEQLLKRGQGVPLVQVENGFCKNCNLRVIPQTMNTIRAGKIASCDNCMHLIYCRSEEEE